MPAALPPVAPQVRLRHGWAWLAALTALYLASLSPGGRPAGFSELWDGWVRCAVLGGAAALLLLRGRRGDGEARAWRLLGTGAASWTAGSVAYAVDLQARDVMPFPSYADALWLLFYPFAFAGVLALVRARVQSAPRSVWVDGLVGGLTVAAVVVQVSLGPGLALAPGGVAAATTNAAYPVASLLLLLVLAGVLALLGWRPGAGWWLLVAGVGGFVVSDAVYLVQVTSGTFAEGSLVQGGWPLAFVLLAGAGLLEAPPRRRVRSGSLPALAVPVLSASVSLVLLWWGSRGSTEPVAGVLALVAVLLAVVRTLLSYRHVAALAESRLQARTDELTGLPNRRCFLEALATETAGPRPGSVVLLDVDRFKDVNDSLGHAAGDALLVAISVRAGGVVPASGLLARLGGDEFAVLLPGVGADAAAEVAGRVLAALSAPFVIDGVSLHMGASAGVAPVHAGEERTGPLRRADAALYAAKQSRQGVAVYRDDLDRHTRERLELLEELRTALDEGQLLLHYQPKLDLRTDEVVSVEALVRWRHPTRGLVPPDVFVPLVEQAGLMEQLTEVVLRQALRQGAVWAAQGRPLPVAVNVSPTSLLDPRLPRRVAGLLREHGLPASALEVEITEGVLLLDRDRAVEVLKGLRDLGVRLAVDDYGTGYSSLAYLRELPVHDLKLDRAFVMQLDGDPLSRAIVRSTIELAHALGLEMVAEGVETEAALEQLRSWGCDLAQGYHLSRPLPAEALDAWLAARAERVVVVA